MSFVYMILQTKFCLEEALPCLPLYILCFVLILLLLLWKWPLLGRRFLGFLSPRKSMLPYKSVFEKFLLWELTFLFDYFLGNSAKIWDSCFFLFLSRKSFAPECTRQQEEELLQSLLLVSAWKIVKMKRALPSGEVAAASKLFEKFFAAEEFEDILYFHNELCNVLKICPGPLSSFYNVIKVQLSTLHFCA
mgnify:CR=1 FL=1